LAFFAIVGFHHGGRPSRRGQGGKRKKEKKEKSTQERKEVRSYHLFSITRG